MCELCLSCLYMSSWTDDVFKDGDLGIELMYIYHIQLMLKLNKIKMLGLV
jgi:hypothetical protein